MTLEFLRKQLVEEGMDVDAEIAALEPGDELTSKRSRALYGVILGILILILGGAAIVVIYLSERINIFETLLGLNLKVTSDKLAEHVTLVRILLAICPRKSLESNGRGRDLRR